MEVTKKNFKETLPLIKESIQKADFLAIDAEFTGLINVFDFNKLIKEGISYMTESTESRLRENLTERQKNCSIEKETIAIPDQHKQQITDICKKVRKFLDDKDSRRNGNR
ncbi:hypothetical protein ACJJTC_003935 [Scirpophaga incertulas]